MYRSGSTTHHRSPIYARAASTRSSASALCQTNSRYLPFSMVRVVIRLSLAYRNQLSGTRSLAEATPLGSGLLPRHRFAPVEVPEVPVHGLGEPAGQVLRRLPIELPPDVADVYGVASVMAGAVLHELDQPLVGPVRRTRP